MLANVSDYSLSRNLTLLVMLTSIIWPHLGQDTSRVRGLPITLSTSDVTTESILSSLSSNMLRRLITCSISWLRSACTTGSPLSRETNL
jgi:hypothetical protein